MLQHPPPPFPKTLRSQPRAPKVRYTGLPFPVLPAQAQQGLQGKARALHQLPVMPVPLLQLPAVIGSSALQREPQVRGCSSALAQQLPRGVLAAGKDRSAASLGAWRRAGAASGARSIVGPERARFRPARRALLSGRQRGSEPGGMGEGLLLRL